MGEPGLTSRFRAIVQGGVLLRMPHVSGEAGEAVSW